MDELCGAHDAGNQHSQIHTKFAEAFMANNLRGILTTTENNVNNLHHEKKREKDDITQSSRNNVGDFTNVCGSFETNYLKGFSEMSKPNNFLYIHFYIEDKHE